MGDASHLTFTNSHSAIKVKQGFSWPAFFFGSLWAAAKRMWFPYFFGLIVVDIGLWFLNGYAQATRNLGLVLFALIATIVYAVVRGRRGNCWHANSLLSRGYEASKRAK